MAADGPVQCCRRECTAYTECPKTHRRYEESCTSRGRTEEDRQTAWEGDTLILSSRSSLLCLTRKSITMILHFTLYTNMLSCQLLFLSNVSWNLIFGLDLIHFLRSKVGKSEQNTSVNEIKLSYTLWDNYMRHSSDCYFLDLLFYVCLFILSSFYLLLWGIFESQGFSVHPASYKPLADLNTKTQLQALFNDWLQLRVADPIAEL